MITEEDAKNFINNLNWEYAKSYSKTFPHYYTKKDDAKDKELWVKFIKYMRHHAVIKTFYSKEYLYYELDDYEYWEMGRPAMAVQIINKAKINDKAKYRKYKTSITNEKILKNKLEQRDMYLEELLCKTDKSINDIKQINFLLDTVRKIDGGGKNIIDHSSLNIIYE
jgi:phosphoribosyl-AMP cyclohydrolase